MDRGTHAHTHTCTYIETHTGTHYPTHARHYVQMSYRASHCPFSMQSANGHKNSRETRTCQGLPPLPTSLLSLPSPPAVSPASTCLAAVSAPPLPGVLALWLLIAAHNSTSREVSRCPTHTMPAQWAHSRLSSCLRHLLLRLQLRLQTPKLPSCLAAELTAASESNLQYAISKVFSVSRSKGRRQMKAAGMGCGVAGTFTSVSPSICPSVPLSSYRGANILCCVVVVVVFGLVLFCVLVSKLLSHYYVYCSSFRLSFACRKLWALIPSFTLVSPITSRLHFIKVIAPINSATQTPEIPT